jgi:transcriptional regulator with XRE-family HTH domain
MSPDTDQPIRPQARPPARLAGSAGSPAGSAGSLAGSAGSRGRPAAAEVAEFLRARRSRLRPGDVGLPAGARRRTAGLRREEVAQLADISASYYTFLEQGRDVRPSEQVLEALGRALRLTPAERSHLHDLVHGGPAAGFLPPDTLLPAVAAMVSRLDPWPAYVTGRYFDVLASNQAARALWTDWTACAPAERNVLWWTFADPAARGVLVEWESEARAQLARFRAISARHPDDPRFGELAARLQDRCAEARHWWPEHDVAPLSSGVKRIRHPALGIIDFRHAVLQVADDPEQKLVTFTAGPDDTARIAALIGT